MKRTLPGVVVAALLTVAAAAAAFYIESRPGGAPSQTTMAGSMFVSDAGKSHGGFEYTATWNASLQASGSTGNLTFVLQVGLGDALTRHQFAVTDFSKNSTNISMKLDGSPVTLVWTGKDPIWNGTYDHRYVASWGGYAPQNEIRGSISPTIFPGLTSFWYVELRFALMPQ